MTQQLSLTPTFRAALERRCIIVYTGQSRISGDTINAVLDAYRSRAKWISIAIHSFLAFMFFNGAVVFAHGYVRWFGAAATIALLAYWIRTATSARTESV